MSKISKICIKLNNYLNLNRLYSHILLQIYQKDLQHRLKCILTHIDHHINKTLHKSITKILHLHHHHITIKTIVIQDLINNNNFISIKLYKTTV